MRSIDNKNRSRVVIENGAAQQADITAVTAPCIGGKMKMITTILLEEDDDDDGYFNKYFAAFIVFKQLLDMLVFHAVLRSGQLLPIIDPTCSWQIMLSAVLWSTISTLVWLTVFTLVMRIRRGADSSTITVMVSSAKRGNSRSEVALLVPLLDHEKVLEPTDILRYLVATKDGVIWIVCELVILGIQRDARFTRWTLLATLTLCVSSNMMFVAFGKGKRNHFLGWWIQVGTLVWIASEIMVSLAMDELSFTARVVLAVVVMTVMIYGVLGMVVCVVMKLDESTQEEDHEKDDENEEGRVRSTTEDTGALHGVLAQSSTQSSVY
jgi:hypothetical protein